MHIPVLCERAIELLDPQNGDVVLDATLGLGGHAGILCEKIAPKGMLVGIDRDSEILRLAKNNLKNKNCRVDLVESNFGDLDKVLADLKIKKIDKALFDLGMNSIHIDTSGRGFTFQKDEPLLMNFKTKLEDDDLTAREILNIWPEEDIVDILREYGEEKFAKRIGRGIVERRSEQAFETTFDLVRVIEKNVPKSYLHSRISPATRTFQALRIAVNDELEVLRKGLEKAWGRLAEEGRVAVISFHSLEDRIVKNFFRDLKNKGEAKVLTKKPVVAEEEEIKKNPRSRSAKLRVAVKL